MMLILEASFPCKEIKNKNRRGTRIRAAREWEGPRWERELSATSAAECSACLSVVQKLGLSKTSPLKLTVALNLGAWSGPSLIHVYDGRLKQLRWASSCSWFLYILFPPQPQPFSKLLTITARWPDPSSYLDSPLGDARSDRRREVIRSPPSSLSTIGEEFERGVYLGVFFFLS